MKHSIKKMALVLVLSGSTQAAELQVVIDHISSDQGMVYAQLFAGAENYKSNKAHQGTMIAAKKGQNTFSFKGLPAGEYAVQMYHDENDNKKMDRNAFGMPTEGYGFSNEAVGSMGPPTFKQMKVLIKENDEVVKTATKMVYL